LDCGIRTKYPKQKSVGGNIYTVEKGQAAAGPNGFYSAGG